MEDNYETNQPPMVERFYANNDELCEIARALVKQHGGVVVVAEQFGLSHAAVSMALSGRSKLTVRRIIETFGNQRVTPGYSLVEDTD